jgi:hypothetical protein
MRRVTLNAGFVLATGFGLTLALLWLLNSSPAVPAAARVADLPRPIGSPGDVYCVTPDGGVPYLGCKQVFTNVQAAVDFASGGDIIKVATGVYTDVHMRPRNDVTTTGVVTQVVYISKSITIQGGYTTTLGGWTTPYPITQPTTLDAQRQGRVLYITGNISPTIEGLRITAGNATGLRGDPEGYGAGGGVYIISATVTLSNSHVFSNTAGDGGSSNVRGGPGGGIYSTGMLILADSTVSHNATSGGILYSGVSGGSGGGIYNSGVLILDHSTVINNSTGDGGSQPYGFAGSGGFGGGIYSNGVLTITDSSVCGNSTGDGGYSNNIMDGGNGGSGGGVYNHAGMPMSIINTIVCSNHTGDGADHNGQGGSGGGIYNGGTLMLDRSTVISNSTGWGGGGGEFDYGASGGPGGGIYSLGPLDSVGKLKIAGTVPHRSAKLVRLSPLGARIAPTSRGLPPLGRENLQSPVGAD